MCIFLKTKAKLIEYLDVFLQYDKYSPLSRDIHIQFEDSVYMQEVGKTADDVINEQIVEKLPDRRYAKIKISDFKELKSVKERYNFLKEKGRNYIE